jgi:hypothetical protein
MINKNMQRTHSTRVVNSAPQFTQPEYYKSPPALISDLAKSSRDRDPLKHELTLLALSDSQRKKAFYRDRYIAIRALHECFARHICLVTGQVKISLKAAAISCGLATVSQAERAKADADPAYNPYYCISRAWRALQDMIALGWIAYKKEDQVFDKETKTWLDLYFEITPAFYKVVGITEERWQKHHRRALGRYKQKALSLGLSIEEVAQMSLTEIKQRERINHRNRVFDKRKKAQAAAALRRFAARADQEQFRLTAAQRVLNALSYSERRNLSDDKLNTLVNYEVANMRSLARLPALH